MIPKSKGKTKDKRLTNPNKVNQYTPPDPRQALFLAYFMDPKSETFSNALQSGLRAGFAQQYSENLKNLMPEWLSEALEEMQAADLLRKAKRNIAQVLDLDHIVPAMGPFGPLYEKVETKVKDKNGKEKKKVKKIPIMRVSTGILKIKTDTSEFVAERLDRKKFGKEAPKIGKLSFNFQNIQGDKNEYK